MKTAAPVSFWRITTRHPGGECSARTMSATSIDEALTLNQTPPGARIRSISVQCDGMTKHGQRCRRWTSIGTCRYHL